MSIGGQGGEGGAGRRACVCVSEGGMCWSCMNVMGAVRFSLLSSSSTLLLSLTSAALRVLGGLGSPFTAGSVEGVVLNCASSGRVGFCMGPSVTCSVLKYATHLVVPLWVRFESVLWLQYNLLVGLLAWESRAAS